MDQQDQADQQNRAGPSGAGGPSSMLVLEAHNEGPAEPWIPPGPPQFPSRRAVQTGHLERSSSRSRSTSSMSHSEGVPTSLDVEVR